MAYYMNRRVHLASGSTEPDTDTETSWDSFDLSKTGQHIASTMLYDNTASWCRTEPLDPVGMTRMNADDDRVFFGAGAQGHAYIWSFGDGHAMELDHMSPHCVTKTEGIAFFNGADLSADGRFLYYTASNLLYMKDLGEGNEFNLARSYVPTAQNMSQYVGSPVVVLKFSDDGMSLYVQPQREGSIRRLSMTAPYDVTTCSERDSLDIGSLSGVSGEKTRAFDVSPGGRWALVAGRSSSGSSVYKLELTTPYDLSTAVIRSSMALTFDGTPKIDALVASRDGRRMIVVDNKSASSRTLYEFELVS